MMLTLTERGNRSITSLRCDLKDWIEVDALSKLRLKCLLNIYMDVPNTIECMSEEKGEKMVSELDFNYLQFNLMNIIEQVVYSSQKRDEKTNRKSSLLSLHQYMGRTSITLLYDNRLNEEMDQVPNEVETMRRLIKMVK